jgi:lactose/L-arabinose transport system substrate-binding protein
MNFAKRFTIRSTAAAMIGLALGTTGLMASHAANAGEVTIWAWDPNFNIAIMQEAAKRYTAKNPGVTFKIVDMAKADLEQKLQTTLASGVTKSLPDIVLVEDYNAPKYLRSFPGAFESMSGKVDYKGFAKYKVDLMTLNGKVYGLPFDSGVTGMYYRKDLLAKAGFAERTCKTSPGTATSKSARKSKPPPARRCWALTPMTTAWCA